MNQTLSSDHPLTGAKTVIHNTVLLLAGQIAVQGSSMILGIITARTLGEAGYGQYSLALAFVGIFSLLFTMGVDSIVVRDIAQARDNSGVTILGNALWLRLVGLPLTLVVTTTAAWLLGYQQEQRHLVLLASLALGLTAAADLPRSYFRGRQQMHHDAINRVVEKSCTLVLAAFGLVLTHSARAVLVAMVIGACVALLIGARTTRRLLGRIKLGPPQSSLMLLKRSVPLAGAFALVAIYTQLPTVFLSRIRDVGEVGLYSAAYNIVVPLSFIPLALGTAMLPALSALARSEPARIDRDHGTILSYMLVIALPLTASVILFRTDLIQALFGSSFVAAAPALLILALSLPLMFCSLYLNNLLIALESQHLVLLASVGCLAATVVANALLVPMLGFVGTAISYVLVYGFSLALLSYWTSRWVTHRLERKVAGALVGTTLMVIGVTLARTTALYLRVPLAAGLFSLGFMATSGMSSSDIKFLIETLLGFSKHTSQRPEG